MGERTGKAEHGKDVREEHREAVLQECLQLGRSVDRREDVGETEHRAAGDTELQIEIASFCVEV